MKRIRFLIICSLLILIFTACSSNKTDIGEENITETEEVTEAEWVQAYKDFLNEPANIQKFISADFANSYEKTEYLSNQSELSGYSLYDFNKDDIPELMLCDEYSGRINVFTYSESDQVNYVTSLYKNKPYNLEEPARVYGYNKETGEVIFYEEKYNGDYNFEGMCIAFYQLDLNTNALTNNVEIENSYTQTLLWEDKTFYLINGWIPGEQSNSLRTELWDSFMRNKGEEISKKFAPFVWHTMDEIDTYISMNYQNENEKLQTYEVTKLFKQIVPEAEPPRDKEYRVEKFWFAGKYNEICKTAYYSLSLGVDDLREDNLEIADDFEQQAIVNVLNQIALDCGYVDIVIHMNPTLNNETGIYEAIVQFDYDYWIVFYEPNEDWAAAYQDTTGYFATIYTPYEEEVEWDE